MALKILSDRQIRDLDAYTIEHEPITSNKLMWRAAKAFTAAFTKRFPSRLYPVHILCGMGNNGGDGLCIGMMLKQKGYPVSLYAVKYTKKGSDDFNHYAEQLQNQNLSLHNIETEEDIPLFGKNEIIIEGLWGTGLSHPIEGIGASVIDAINKSEARIVSIDIPSGLNTNDVNEYIKIRADLTISFQLPKLCFFVQDTGPFCGKTIWVDIGLAKEKIDQTDCSTFFLEETDIFPLLPKRERFSHKGSYGRSLLIGGSRGLAGAITFASRAAHEAGAGLVTAAVPAELVQIIQSNQPETMVLANKGQASIENLPEEINSFDAIAYGPGIGKDSCPERALEDLLKAAPSNLVIDADGLNILSRKPHLLDLLPSNTILTPHVGEFDRLAGSSTNGFNRLEMLKSKAKEWKVWIVLKDSYTAIASPSGMVYINPTGNALLAHGGSGDVLCGLITGLLARGLNPGDACKLGVYLHGLAADLFRDKTGEDVLMPLDLCDWIKQAHKRLLQTQFYG